MKTTVKIGCIAVTMLAWSFTGMQAMQKVLTASRNFLFVRNTLVQAYPELSGRHMLVQENVKEVGFSVQLDHTENRDVVNVPFTEAELLQAEQLKKDGKTIGTEELMVKLSAAGYKRILMNVINQRHNGIYKKRWYPKIFSLLERYGYACSNTTFDLWQGLLIHEGAHMLYQDHKEACLEEKLQVLLEARNHSLRALSNLLETIMPLYKSSCIAEYRADQEAIKRIQDATMLRLLSTYHADQGFWKIMFNDGRDKPLSVRMEELFSPHPEDAMRDKYFAQAARDLEARQAQLKS